MNRKANSKNHFQGEYKKVLCVCSAGLLRSPTTALVLSGPPFNFNTRSAGINDEFALTPVDEVLLYWADEVVCMEGGQEREIRLRLDKLNRKDVKSYSLGIPDVYAYRDDNLMELIQERYLEVVGVNPCE